MNLPTDDPNIARVRRNRAESFLAVVVAAFVICALFGAVVLYRTLIGR